ncbi:MAG: DUF3619 family protein, partial [Proteobacteria bacterium]|nr:DUF3619 family protein [Pseudomonadota bacterium]
MNTSELNFAYKVRHALNERLDTLPAATTKRLASSRNIALSRKKSESPLHVRLTQAALASPVGSFIDEQLSWATRIGVAMPILIGALVFVGMYKYEQQVRIAETAEIDAAVLSDDLPLSAYADS